MTDATVKTTGEARGAAGYSKDGKFQHQQSLFKITISIDGDHPPESGRYILYAAYSCPFAARCLLSHKLKGLDAIVEVALVHHHLGEDSWAFDPNCAECTTDPVYGVRLLKELYHRADPSYDLKFTVPALWDKQRETFVSNDSMDILHMFEHGFDTILDDSGPRRALDLYPESLKAEIDEINSWVSETITKGVYKVGFAPSQAAYNAGIIPLFESLDRVERMLTDRDFLCGSGKGQLSEADICLFPTIVRFDVVYYPLFKCNIRMIREYPNLNRWLRNLYWTYSAFKDVTNFEHIKGGYYDSRNTEHLNPTRVIARGPQPSIMGPL